MVQRLTCDSAPASDTDTLSHLKMKHSLEESRCAVPGVWSFISKFYHVLLLTVNPTAGTTPEVSTDNKKRNSTVNYLSNEIKFLNPFVIALR